MSKEHDKQREVVDILLKETGLAPSALAVKAGLSTSTLNRFMMDGSTQTLRPDNLNAICHVAGYASYEDFTLQQRFGMAAPAPAKFMSAISGTVKNDHIKLLANARVWHYLDENNILMNEREAQPIVEALEKRIAEDVGNGADPRRMQYAGFIQQQVRNRGAGKTI